MDIFKIHRRIVGDYANYIRSFVSIADEDLRQRVAQHLDDGHLWPEPLLSFNPAFASAGKIEILVSSGVLSPPLGDAFRGYELFEHQLKAIQIGAAGGDFVVTSGTGSGKSLTYIAAVFDHLFKAGSPLPSGVTAVVVYPLNALVNSQEEELRRYAENYKQARGEEFPIRFAKFTGQEDITRRQELEAEPPHLLLTNYMMLELLLKGAYSEKDLERAILRELEEFLVELGSDFAFVARQKRIVVDGEDFYLDLLFYHRRLRRLVVIDLKLEKFTPSDVGQMEFYMRWLKKHEMRPGENEPLGLILCAEKSDERIELFELAKRGIRVGEYLTELPPKKQLAQRLHDAVQLARARLGEKVTSAKGLPTPKSRRRKKA